MQYVIQSWRKCLWSQTSSSLLTYFNSFLHYIMQSYNLQGHALCYPIIEEMPVVTDFKFLADVFQQLFFESAPRTVHLRSLGDNIPCWTSADLEKIYPKSKATVVSLTFLKPAPRLRNFFHAQLNLSQTLSCS